MRDRGFSVEVIPIMSLPERKHLTKPKKARRKRTSRRKRKDRKTDRRQVYVRSLNHAHV